MLSLGFQENQDTGHKVGDINIMHHPVVPVMMSIHLTRKVSAINLIFLLCIKPLIVVIYTCVRQIHVYKSSRLWCSRYGSVRETIFVYNRLRNRQY